jgi:aldehyde dehydrogenase (NAD+)
MRYRFFLPDSQAKLREEAPLVDQIQYDKVQGYIQSGIDQGATLALGGISSDKNAGFFVPTTIFTDLTDKMKINQEEIFGPVLCVSKFKTEQEIIERANATSFGLAAGVHTRDIKLANRMINNLDAGMVW